MSFYEDVYCKPEKYGLEIMTEVEWSHEPYQFTVTVIWRDKETGQLYIGSDSGCSCPSPFEDVRSVDQLTPVTVHEALNELKDDFEKINPDSKWINYESILEDYTAAVYKLMFLKD